MKRYIKPNSELYIIQAEVHILEGSPSPLLNSSEETGDNEARDLNDILDVIDNLN